LDILWIINKIINNKYLFSTCFNYTDIKLF
jgi:hypothetical protein